MPWQGPSEPQQQRQQQRHQHNCSSRRRQSRRSRRSCSGSSSCSRSSSRSNSRSRAAPEAAGRGRIDSEGMGRREGVLETVVIERSGQVVGARQSRSTFCVTCPPTQPLAGVAGVGVAVLALASQCWHCWRWRRSDGVGVAAVVLALASQCWRCWRWRRSASVKLLASPCCGTLDTHPGACMHQRSAGSCYQRWLWSLRSKVSVSPPPAQRPCSWCRHPDRKACAHTHSNGIR